MKLLKIQPVFHVRVPDILPAKFELRETTSGAMFLNLDHIKSICPYADKFEEKQIFQFHEHIDGPYVAIGYVVGLVELQDLIAQ
jgi:hypothetical protein